MYPAMETLPSALTRCIAIPPATATLPQVWRALKTSTGNFNTAVGWQALFGNQTSPNNTAVGYAALQNNSTGSGNTAIGFSALVLT